MFGYVLLVVIGGVMVWCGELMVCIVGDYGF